MSGTDEWIPWYRRKEYKGNLTEDEKRHLDTFRVEGKHPATAFEELPKEVQEYLNELELSVYDATQERVAIKSLVQTCVGALLIFLAYLGLGWLSPLVGYFLGCAIITFAWFNHSRDWKQNADSIWIKQKGKGVPLSRTEDKLQEYWDLDAIGRFRKR
jgi:hypothetical protein